MHNVRQDAVPL